MSQATRQLYPNIRMKLFGITVLMAIKNVKTGDEYQPIGSTTDKVMVNKQQ